MSEEMISHQWRHDAFIRHYDFNNFNGDMKFGIVELEFIAKEDLAHFVW